MWYNVIDSFGPQQAQEEGTTICPDLGPLVLTGTFPVIAVDPRPQVGACCILEETVANYCVDCGKEISKSAKRCRECANRTRERRESAAQGGRKRWEGKRAVPNYCIDCGILVSGHEPHRCASCHTRHLWTIPEIRKKMRVSVWSEETRVRHAENCRAIARTKESSWETNPPLCANCGKVVSSRVVTLCRECYIEKLSNEAAARAEERRVFCMDCGVELARPDNHPKRCQSCNAKYQWAIGVMDKRNTPEYRAKLAQATKNAWARGDMDEIFTDEYRQKQADATQKRWASGEFDGVFTSPEHREKLSRALKKARKEGKYDHVDYSKDEEFRRKISIGVRRAWERGDYANKRVYNDSRRTSKLEQSVLDAIECLGIDLITQHSLPDDARPFDAFLPKFNILLEVEGEFFHHSAWSKAHGQDKRDKSKYRLARESGYTLVIIREKEVNQLGAMEVVRRKVLSKIDKGDE